MTTDSQLPEPLTPSDCDLQDFRFMALDVVRLRDSDLAAKASADEFRAAVLLWCAAWHQLPAGSVPDDDIVLAQLAGYGRVVAEWLKVKQGAMRGWVKCSDGRLYHPVVAEKVVEAWFAKLKKRAELEGDRQRKAAKALEAAQGNLQLSGGKAGNSAGIVLPNPQGESPITSEGKKRISGGNEKSANSGGNLLNSGGGDVKSGGIATDSSGNPGGNSLIGEDRDRDITSTHIQNSPTGTSDGHAPAPGNQRTRAKPKTTIPDAFSISERVRKWAQEKGYDRLEDHLAHFITKCRAKGYVYSDWDSAFEGAIRDDWAGLRVSKYVVPKNQSGKTGKSGQVVRPQGGFGQSGRM